MVPDGGSVSKSSGRKSGKHSSVSNRTPSVVPGSGKRKRGKNLIPWTFCCSFLWMFLWEHVCFLR